MPAALRSAGEPVAGRGLMSGWHGAKRNDWTEPISIRAFRRGFSTELIISHLQITPWKASRHGKGAAVGRFAIRSISIFYKHLHGRHGGGLTSFGVKPHVAGAPPLEYTQSGGYRPGAAGGSL